MKPFYNRNGITIYHGNNIEIAQVISGFNCVVTSPPYNQSLDKFKGSGMHKKSKWVRRMAKAYSDNLPEHVYQNRIAILFGIIADRMPFDGSVFINHKVRYRDRTAVLPSDISFSPALDLYQEIIWDRSSGIQFNSRRFCPSEERVLWFRRFDGVPKWNQSEVAKMSVWKINPVTAKTGPPQFPIELVSNCIAATTSPGDIVFDPFMGSGSTAVACSKLKRKFIGIELEKKWCRMAVERIESV